MPRSPVTLAAAALLAIGCAPKDAAKSSDSTTTVATTVTTTSSTATTAASTSPSSVPGPNVVTIRARDYSYDAPAQIPAGMTTFKLVNEGSTLHHVILFRLDSNKTVNDAVRMLGTPNTPMPHWMLPMGGPNAPDPAHESNATVDMQPGNYALICVIDVPKPAPHFMKGMSKALTVVPSSAPPVAPPVADVSITLSDYNFAISKPLTAGTHTFEVKNTAAQPHEAFVARLAPGKTANDLLAWLDKPVGPPPAAAIGGVTPIMMNTNYFTADLAAGEYAMICFVPDMKDGKPHFAHGMVKQFTVT